MKPNSELTELKRIILSWRERYGEIAQETGGGEFLWKDFREEIEEMAFPYVARLFRAGAIDEDELTDFRLYCRGQVEELSRIVGEEAGDA